MNSKWHLYISLIKSWIRIIGCVVGIKWGFGWLAIMFLVAEVLGIVEEVGDNR